MPRFISPRVRGVFLPTDQSSGSSAFWAARSALSRRSCSSPGAEGGVAKTGLWKVPSEWKFPLPSIHVGEDSCPARKVTTSKRPEHPPCIRRVFVAHQARVRPARPFAPIPQSDAHTGPAILTQRTKPRPKGVACRGT